MNAGVWASQVAQWKKIRLPVQEKWGMRVGSLGWEDPLEEEMVIHSSIVAWEILWMGYSPWDCRLGHNSGAE